MYQALPPPPDELTEIDVEKTGDDFINMDPEKSIEDFITESLADNEVPIVIKIISENLQQEQVIYKLLTLNTFNNINNENSAVVYPCWQDSNISTITDYVTEANGNRINIPIPEGLQLSDPNVREDTPLISLQQVIGFRGCVEREYFQNAINEQMNNGPIFMTLYFDGETVPALAKLPFVAGPSKLHCNREQTRTVEKILKIIVPQTNYGYPGEVLFRGGRRRKKTMKKRRTVKTKRSKKTYANTNTKSKRHKKRKSIKRRK